MQLIVNRKLSARLHKCSVSCRFIMKIKEVTKATIFYVETDEEDYYRYIRHGANSWTVTMGESDEPVYDCKELEQMFQEWLSKNGS